MATSNAVATWEGKLKEGKGTFKAQSGAFNGAFSFGTRFEGKKGTNPEELLAAAHAGIFFRPPASIASQFPQFRVTQTYQELEAAIVAAAQS